MIARLIRYVRRLFLRVPPPRGSFYQRGNIVGVVCGEPPPYMPDRVPVVQSGIVWMEAPCDVEKDEQATIDGVPIEARWSQSLRSGEVGLLRVGPRAQEETRIWMEPFDEEEEE